MFPNLGVNEFLVVLSFHNTLSVKTEIILLGK